MSRAGVKNWGDDDEDELPEVHDTAVDAKGFKTRTEYIINDRSQKVKVTSKIRVIEEVIFRESSRELPEQAFTPTPPRRRLLQKMRTPIAVKERRARLQKFGNAIGVVDESNVTIIDYNEVPFLLLLFVSTPLARAERPADLVSSCPDLHAYPEGLRG